MRKPSFILFQADENLWGAAPPGFRDYERDPVGWGNTAQEAVAFLLVREDYQYRARVTGWTPTLVDFAVVPVPPGAQSPGDAARTRPGDKASPGLRLIHPN